MMWKRYLSIAFAMAVVLALPALAFAGADPASADGGEWAQYQAKGWVWMYLGAFGFGFLTSLTPCVYPMIPIVVGVFGARDESVTRIKAFILATCYVLGMGAMYAGLGVIFALLGKQFGAILANPWVVIPLVLFYVALAASMFGAFELNLPASLQDRLNRVGGKGYAGAFGMGLVGGLTAAPCTGPFLAGILGFVATTRNVLAGSTLLFTFAIGMGVLFWVIAAFTVSLPRSGRWMEWIKSFGGIALLAVAIYFLRPLLPWIETLTHTSKLFVIGAGALVVLGGVLGAIHLSFHDMWPVRVRKALGVLFMVVGITGVVNWVLTPDRHLSWNHSEEVAFAQARAEGKGVMIDFAASWCAPCKELELTFAADGVYELIGENFVPLRFDVSEGTDEDEARKAKWNAKTLPAVLFLDAEGKELARVDKYLARDAFLDILTPAAGQIRKQAKAAPDKDQESIQAKVAPARVQGTAQSAAAGAPAAQPEQATTQGIDWFEDDIEAFMTAEFSGKGVFIDFYANWCAPCLEMKKTFADATVASAIAENYIPVHLDMTEMTEADQKKLLGYGIKELPAMVFFESSGQEALRITEFVTPAEFLASMEKARMARANN